MTFNELNMSEPILKAVREKGYDELTPIQQRAIPIVLRGADILGIAQTGTGKTAAFALPLLQRLIEERSLEREPSAVAGETVPLRRERRGRSHGKKRPPCYSVPRSDPHAGARPSDRRVVRRLRKVYGPEARDDFRGSQAGTSDGQAPPGHRYSDRHSRTSARPDRSGRGRTREPVAFRAGRGGPDARHGLYRRYQALVAVASGPAPDASFLGHHAPGYRGSVGLRLARSGTGSR